MDVGNSIVLFGSSMLLSVLPFIIFLSSLANHRIDTDLSLHIGLNSQGDRIIISQLFRSSPHADILRYGVQQTGNDTQSRSKHRSSAPG